MRLLVLMHTEGLRVPVGSLSFTSAFLLVPVILLAGKDPRRRDVWRDILPASCCRRFPSTPEKPFLQNQSLLFQWPVPGCLQIPSTAAAAELHRAPTTGLLGPDRGCVWHEHPRNLLQAGRNKVERHVYNCWGGKHRRGSRNSPAQQSHGPAVKELVLHKEKWRASSKLALLSALGTINKEGTGQRYWIIKLADSRALSGAGMCCMPSR